MMECECSYFGIVVAVGGGVLWDSTVRKLAVVHCVVHHLLWDVLRSAIVNWFPSHCCVSPRSGVRFVSLYHRLLWSLQESFTILLLPLALQPTVGFVLSNNVLPFFSYLPPTLSIFSIPALSLSIFSWVFPFFSSRKFYDGALKETFGISVSLGRI